MTTLSEFYLGAMADVMPVEAFEITHPSMSQAWRFTPQMPEGATLGGLDFDYMPAVVQPAGESDDLDHEFTIQLGDLGDVIPGEIDLIEAADEMTVKPALRYWLFSSADLVEPLLGPVDLEVADVTLTPEGSAINARAPRLSLNRTGEMYTLARFPMLQGFL